MLSGITLHVVITLCDIIVFLPQEKTTWPKRKEITWVKNEPWWIKFLCLSWNQWITSKVKINVYAESCLHLMFTIDSNAVFFHSELTNCFPIYNLQSICKPPSSSFFSSPLASTIAMHIEGLERFKPDLFLLTMTEMILNLQRVHSSFHQHFNSVYPIFTAVL